MEDAERLLEEPFSDELKFALSHFSDHVKAERLQHAWDAIAEAGELADAPPRFWEYLAEAAALMKLVERRAEALKRARK